jgi:DNA-nicking Smr family endonuclease
VETQLRAFKKSAPPAVTPPPAPPKPPAATPPARTPERVTPHERVFFLDAMLGVTPLPKDPRGRVDKPPTAKPLVVSEAWDALADLRDLVEGRSAFTIQYTDEYMEGVAPGVDFRLAQRLHQGDYAVQAHLDLHGHTVDEARIAVERFVTSAYTLGQRCLRLVHGRGRNSRDNRPVLKEQVHLWLSHGRLSRLVLAFATAPLTDGGAGAVYVLLRRASGFQKK